MIVMSLGFTAQTPDSAGVVAPRPFVSGSVPASPWPASAPELVDRRQDRERRRLRWIFGFEGKCEKNPHVSPHALHQALDHRQDFAASMGLDRVAAVLGAIAHFHTQAPGSREDQGRSATEAPCH